MSFSFYADYICACGRLPQTTADLFKLRMYRRLDDSEETGETLGASRYHIAYMILRKGAYGSDFCDRIGWASFDVALVDDTAFPELLDGEKEEVITIV